MKVDQMTGEIVSFHRQDRISEHFKLSEFCRGAELWPVHYAERLFRLALMLEDVRAHIGTQIKITSGYRSPEHNRATRGAATYSAHILGYAVDFRAVRPGGEDAEADTAEAHKFLKENRSTWRICGLGWYPKDLMEPSGILRKHSRVHADLRHLPFREWRK